MNSRSLESRNGGVGDGESSRSLTLLADLENHVHTAFPAANMSTLAKYGDLKLVDEFLSEKMSVKSSPNSSMADAIHGQLYIAAFWGFRDMVRQLVEMGADVNHPNHGTLWTPIHAATFQEHGPVINLLLELQADPTLLDAEGRSGVDFASASDKIWPLFAARGYRRVPKTKLLEMHVLGEIPASDLTREPLGNDKEESFMDDIRRASSRMQRPMPVNPITGEFLGASGSDSRSSSVNGYK